MSDMDIRDMSADDDHDETSSYKDTLQSIHMGGSKSMYTKLKDAVQKMRILVFGTLYVMAKEHQMTLRAIFANILIDFVQMIAFPLDPRFNEWGGSSIAEGLYNFCSFFQAGFWIKRLDASGVNWLIRTCYTVVFFSVLNAVYVGWCYLRNKFSVMWPVRLLRTLVGFFATVLAVPFLSIMFLVYCPSDVDTGPCVSLDIQVYDKVLATIAVLFFVPLALTAKFVFYNPNPDTKDVSARASAYVSVLYLSFKVLLVACFILFPSNFHPRSNMYLALFIIGGGLANFVVANLQLNFFRARMNQFMSGLQASFLVCGILAGISLNVDSKNEVMGITLLCAFIPAFIGGWFLTSASISYWYAPTGKRIHTRMGRMLAQWNKLWGNQLEIVPLVISRGKMGGGIVKAATDVASPRGGRNSNTTPTAPYWFPTPYHVELSTRFLQQDQSPEFIDAAHELYKVGMKVYPDSPLVHFHYAQFVKTYLQNHKEAIPLIQQIQDGLGENRSRPRLDIAYFCFAMQEKEKRTTGGTSRGGQSGGAMNLISFIELQKNLQISQKALDAARHKLVKFWDLLLLKEVDLNHLNELMKGIIEAQNNADESFAVLLEKYPEDVEILREYARFLAIVKNSPVQASEFLARAEEIEEVVQEEWKKRMLAGWHKLIINSEGTIVESEQSMDKLYFGKEWTPQDTVTDMNILEVFPLAEMGLHPAITEEKATDYCITDAYFYVAMSCESQICVLTAADGYSIPVSFSVQPVGGEEHGGVLMGDDGDDLFQCDLQVMFEVDEPIIMLDPASGHVLGYSRGFGEVFGEEEPMEMFDSHYSELISFRCDPPQVGYPWEDIEGSVSILQGHSKVQCVVNGWSSFTASFNNPQSEDATNIEETSRQVYVVRLKLDMAALEEERNLFKIRQSNNSGRISQLNVVTKELPNLSNTSASPFTADGSSGSRGSGGPQSPSVNSFHRPNSPLINNMDEKELEIDSPIVESPRRGVYGSGLNINETDLKCAFENEMSISESSQYESDFDEEEAAKVAQMRIVLSKMSPSFQNENISIMKMTRILFVVTVVLAVLIFTNFFFVSSLLVVYDDVGVKLHNSGESLTVLTDAFRQTLHLDLNYRYEDEANNPSSPPSLDDEEVGYPSYLGQPWPQGWESYAGETRRDSIISSLSATASYLISLSDLLYFRTINHADLSKFIKRRFPVVFTNAATGNRTVMDHSPVDIPVLTARSLHGLATLNTSQWSSSKWDSERSNNFVYLTEGNLSWPTSSDFEVPLREVEVELDEEAVIPVETFHVRNMSLSGHEDFEFVAVNLPRSAQDCKYT